MTEERSFSSAELFDLVETLRGATEIGFANVNRLFGGLESRFGDLERRMEFRMDGLERWLVRIDDRLVAIENQNVAGVLRDHEARISRLEGR